MLYSKKKDSKKGNMVVITNNFGLLSCYKAKIKPDKDIASLEFKPYFQNANINNGDFPFKKSACTALKNTTLAFSGYKYKFNVEELIDILAPAIGTKNIPLLKHSYATSLYAEALAKAVKLPLIKVKDVKIAAFFHDIGKLICSEQSFSNINIMKDENKYPQHSEVGRIWLNQVLGMKNKGIDSLIGNHHLFNNDGKNIIDKIIPVADAFDSITVPKYPDSEIMHHLQAIEELRNKKGKNFDPVLVDKFTEIISENDFDLFKKVQSAVYRRTEDFKLDFCLDEKVKPATKIRNLLNPLISGEIYRKTLAKEIGCKPVDLKAVIGPDELSEEIKKLKPENFDPANSDTGIFSVNLHTHTTASDGKFTPEIFFNEVDKQVQKLNESGQKKSFIVAVTDHDTLEGVKGCLKYIAEESQKNPDRFEHIKFVPGIEINSIYNNPKYFKQPVQLEILGYCVNPFDEKLVKMLKKVEGGNRNLINGIITDASEKHGINITDFEERKNYNTALRTAGGPGIRYELNKYLQEKGLDDQQVSALFKGKIVANDYTPHTPDIETVLNSTRGAMTGIAHPSRIKISDKIIENKAVSETLKEKEIAMLRLFKDFAGLGGDSAESNYQHDPQYLRSDEGFKRIINLFPIFCEKVGLLKTGGVDNHGLTLLKRD